MITSSPALSCRAAAVKPAATVIAFPRDRCRAASGKVRGANCTVIILPVVRIERWPEEPARKSTARKAKSKRKTP